MVETFPVLPLRDIVVFPQMIVPLFVGRDKSVAALEARWRRTRSIFLVSQLDPAEDDPGRRALRRRHVATVLQLLKLPDGTVRVLVEGSSAPLVGFDLWRASVGEIEPVEADDSPVNEQVEGADALGRRPVRKLCAAQQEAADDLPGSSAEIEEAARSPTPSPATSRSRSPTSRRMLIESDPARRLEMVFAFMEGELGVLQVEKKIRSRVKRQMEKSQREYYLNEQLKAIQRELGTTEGDEGGDEIAELTQKIANLKLSKEARTKATAEVKKLRTMAPMSAEATVVRNYLDVLLGLPWGKKSKVKKDIAAAQAVLDEDHYGLEKVKDRIVEYLAVQARTNKLKGPILCLVGPPGVGKTSLGRSIAKATGREFVRQSLGGVRDEAEIRGHRRTYIGSLPGKIVSNLKKAGTSNPLFLLDEIDKLGQDFRGDPASALLEVLDPEQNNKFQDHYLEIDIDLSDVMFVTTANSLNLPQPLLDRMEIIRLEGYTEDEKVEIAKRICCQADRGAWPEGRRSSSSPTRALRDLIRYYTREAGVRTLEREIAKLARKALRRILEGKETKRRRHARQSRRIFRRAQASLRRVARKKIRSAPSPASPGPRWAANC
jgi:ATP-dependent Lon protease